MSFFHAILNNPLLFWTVLAIGAVVVVNGWTDAPCAIATCVSSGAMPLRGAAVLAAVCNLIGIGISAVLHPAVIATVCDTVRLPRDGGLSLTVILCAMIATAAWAVVAWFFGIPTSESHALLSGLSGAAVAYGGIGCVVGKAWIRVAVGLVLSLVCGILMGFLAYQAFGGRRATHSERNAKTVLTAGAVAMALMHGAQDGQKLIGFLLLAFSLGGVREEVHPLLILFVALLMGTGTLLGGGRIIKTLGRDLVLAGYREGVSADIGAAACLLLLTWGGFPVSTTHTKTAALMGVGVARGKGGTDGKTALRLFAVWLLTFPSCFALSYLAMRLVMR